MIDLVRRGRKRLCSNLMMATATFCNSVTAVHAEQCDPLSDQQLLIAAFRYELNQSRIPDGYQVGSLEEMLDGDPMCCFVEREDHPFSPEPSWFNWLFPYDTVLISISWLPQDDSGVVYITSYLSTPCGEIGDWFGGFGGVTKFRENR